MATGEGMDKEQWERHMHAFFVRLLKGGPMLFDPLKVGLQIKYAQEPTTEAEWETLAKHQEFDKNIQKFLDVGPPPTDPAARKKWDLERRKRRELYEQRMRSRTGKKCPQCGSWNTIRVDASQARQDMKLLGVVAGPHDDYLVCEDCSTRVMWNKEELEVMHDTEVIFTAEILSRKFMHKGVSVHLNLPVIYVVKVNGRHDCWKQEEVRQMLYRMWMEEICPTWHAETEAAFATKREELRREELGG